MNVAWTGEIWDTLGPAIDMAPYLREDSEIITSLKTKTENLESANYTDRGTLADTDAFMVNDGTGMKRGVLSKLSDFVLNKIADKVFAKLQTNDKTILGAINELNSNPKAQFGMTADIEVAANSIQTIDVTFKKAFKSVPTVLCSLRSGTTNPVYGSVNAFVDYSSVTKTGFTIKIANSATSSAVLRPAVSWIAIA